MKIKRKHLIRLAAGLLAIMLCLPAVSGIFAYLTDMAEEMWNPFTIALDCTTTVIEKYPIPEEDDPNTPVPDGTTIDYEKAVQIGNTGYIDCYVRAYIEFSEEDIKNKSKFSHDGTNYYSFHDYINHLPEGWVYNADDGFFYYTPILYAENWEEVSDRLVYDKKHGEWFYPDEEREIISDVCITTPLIRYVKTEFSNPADMRTYDIHVADESVPFYFGNDYASAWRNYLEMMEE